MIKITHSNNTVILTADTSIGFPIQFDIVRASPMDAILLKNQLRKDLEDHIQKIRREAYNLGWKDKSGHKKKRDWFNGNINSDFI